MTESYFGSIAPIKYEGLQSDNPLAYRYYDKNRVVLGKSMAAQLRPAVVTGTRLPGKARTSSARAPSSAPGIAAVMSCSARRRSC